MTIPDEISEQSNHCTNVQGLFTYTKRDEVTEERIITSCKLNLENVKTVSAENIFKVNSYWKDRDLLYSTVKHMLHLLVRSQHWLTRYTYGAPVFKDIHQGSKTPRTLQKCPSTNNASGRSEWNLHKIEIK